MKRRKFVVSLLTAVGFSLIGRRNEMDELAAQDDQLSATASERIEHHRKGEVTIIVRTPDGKPLAGAELSLTQTRHAFLFGCNIFRWGAHPRPPTRRTLPPAFRCHLQLRHLALLLARL